MKNKFYLYITVVIFITMYLLSGIFILENGQSAIILRFGKKMYEINQSGIHYSFPFPVDSVKKEYVSRVKKITVSDCYGSNKKNSPEKIRGLEIFTGDENLIQVQLVINYDIKNLSDYTIKNNSPDNTIKALATTCMTEAIGKMEIDTVMTIGKTDLKIQLKNKLQKMTDNLSLGVRILGIEFTEISPPEQVLKSFNSVSDARLKKQEIIREAEGYANTVVPEARGNAGSMISMANAYATEIVNEAVAGANVFNQLIKEYEKNPSIITRQLYIDTIKKIFETAKVRVESSPGKSTIYLKDKNFNNKPDQQSGGRE